MNAVSLSIECFGDLRVSVGGDPVPSGVAFKDRELLGYLASAKGRPISRRALASLGWPDDLETEARANLRRLLYRLRRALPAGDWLIEDDAGVRLNAALVTCDLWQFDDALRDNDVERALSLHAGEFLSQFETPWVLAERRRRRDALVSALDKSVGRARSDGAHERALTLARAALRIDPWREDIVRQLASVAYDGGDKAGALNELESFVHRLNSDLNSKPMPETLALLETIQQDRALPESRLRAPSRNDSVSLELPFVGRETALAAIECRFSEAAAGTSSIVTVSGEAGIGKSRLCSHVVLALERRGARALVGLTSTPERQPYEALIDVVRAGLPLLPSLSIAPIWLDVLAGVLPEIAAKRVHAETPVELDANAERLRLFEAFARFLEAVAAARPLLVVLEDLQRGGAGTLEMIESVARRLAKSKILFVLSARNGTTLAPLRRMLGSRHESVRLGAFEPVEVEQLCDAVARGAHVDPVELWRRTNGNPFFVSESLHQIRAQPGKPHGSVPAAAAELVMQRFAQSSERARYVGELAAVAGTSFDLELLRITSGWAASELESGVNELIDAGFVREGPSAGRNDFGFSHQIAREAIYERSVAKTRKRRHARVAEALPRLYASEGEAIYGEVARHYEAASMGAEAAAAYLRSARHSQALFAHLDAIRAVDRGLACTTAQDVRFDLLMVREASAGFLADRVAQQRDLEELEELSRVLTDSSRAFDVAHRLARFYHGGEDRRKELATVETLEAKAQSLAQVCRAALLRAEYAALIGDTSQMKIAAERALELGRELDSPELLVPALCACAQVALARGDFSNTSRFLDEARASARAQPALALQTLREASRIESQRLDFVRLSVVANDALTLARAVGDRAGEAQACASLALAAGGLADFAAAVEHSNRASALYESFGDEHGAAIVTINRVILCYRRGDLQSALHDARNAGKLFERSGDRHGRLTSLLNEALTQVYLGDGAEAARIAALVLSEAAEGENIRFEAHARTVLGAALVQLGDHSNARVMLKAALRGWDSLNETIGQPECLAHLGLACLAVSDNAGMFEAQRRLETYEDELARMEFPQLLLWARAQIAHAAGEASGGDVLRDRAAAAVRSRVESIDDPEIGRLYAALPLNAEIEACARGALWPNVAAKENLTAGQAP